MLENRVAIVTGGAQGIGLACATRLVGLGAKVVVADIDDDAGKAAVGELRAVGEASFVSCDVGERLDIKNLVKQTVDRFGSIDILVNNAGITHAADFLDVEEEDFDRVMRVNLKGMFLASQAAARQMVDQVAAGGRPGTIVNISSINAVMAIPDHVPYVVSKGGVNQLTTVMALALAPHGIRVNAVGPGSVMTDMFRTVAADRDARRSILSRTPLLRVGETDEIASVVAFLASDEASYLTGQTVYVDGGRLGLNYTVQVPD